MRYAWISALLIGLLPAMTLADHRGRDRGCDWGRPHHGGWNWGLVGVSIGIVDGDLTYVGVGYNAPAPAPVYMAPAPVIVCPPPPPAPVVVYPAPVVVYPAPAFRGYYYSEARCVYGR